MQSPSRKPCPDPDDTVAMEKFFYAVFQQVQLNK